jgi:hypothetical protein
MAGFETGTIIGSYSGGLIGFMTAAAAPGFVGYGLHRLVVKLRIP